MRAELTICNRGFAVRVNEYDVSLDTTVILSVYLYWRKPSPRCSWRVEWMSDGQNGQLIYSGYRNGKPWGYRIRGPIERII